MECLGRYAFFVMTSVILSGGMKMRDEHGMLREVYISCHDFCRTFRWYELVGGVAPAAHYNPPTTACGALSVFETPSVLRESFAFKLPPRKAFYALRAFRWTTPPRGRTDPFQGPKIKPMFHRCSLLFQDDLGSKMEATMRSTSS